MADLARLGFVIDTSPLDATTTKLQQMRKAAQQTEQGITSFASGLNDLVNIPSTLGNLEANLQGISDELAAAVPNGREFANQLGNIQYQIQKMEGGIAGAASGFNLDLGRGLSSSIANAVPAADELVSSLNTVNQATGRTTSRFDNTTNAVVNFNRVIQDAPFGILGVANNLDPMIQSFNDLREQTGSATGAFKTLLKSAFTGPGALITTVSVASSLLITFGSNLFSAGEESKEAEEKIKALVDTAQSLNDVLSTDTGIADRISREIERNEQAIQIARERLQIESDIADIREGAIGQNAVLSDTQRRQIDNLQERNTALGNLINLLGFENTEISALQENLKVLNIQQEASAGLIGTQQTKLAAYVDTLRGDAQQAIQRYQTGVDETTEGIEQQIQITQGLINSWQLLAREGNTDVIPAISVLQEVLGDLIGVYEQHGQQAPVVRNNFASIATGARETGDAAEWARKELERLNESMPDLRMDVEDEAARGSISDLQNQLQAFRNMRDIVDPASGAFRELTRSIDETQGKIDELTGKAEDSTQKVSEAARDLGFTFSSAFEDAIIKGESFREVLSGILEDIARIALRTAITRPLGEALAGGISGLNLFGSGGAESVNDALITKEGKIIRGHPNDNWMAFQGDRPPGSGANVNINVINETGSQVEVQERTNPNGGVDIDLMIKRSVQDGFNRGAFDGPMSRNFGVTRKGRR